MSSYDYNSFVSKSVINENYADKTHDILIRDKLIPCEHIDNFYIDSLFYLHLHFSLYLELLYFNSENQFNITQFKSLWDNFKIKFINPSSATTNRYTLTSFTLLDGGSGYTTAPSIIFTPTGDNAITVGSTTIVSGFSSTLTLNTSNTTKDTAVSPNDFQTGDIITINAPSGGTTAIGKITALNGVVTSISFINDANRRGIGYGSSQLTVGGSTAGALSYTITPTRASTLTFTFTPTNYVSSVAINNPAQIYSSSGTFTIQAPVSGTTATINPVTNIPSIGYINNRNKTFVFNTSLFLTHYNRTLQYSNDNLKSKLVTDRVPRIENISSFTTVQPLFTISKIATSEELNTNPYDKSLLIDASDSRINRFQTILKKIFEQDIENILGYLAYQIRYYNIIVLNTSIQRIIYKYYLTNDAIPMDISGIFKLQQSNYNIIETIEDHINKMKANLIKIKEDISSLNNVFSVKKADYPAKINNLQNNENNYIKTQDALNNTAKNYNQYYNNYNKLKIYASSIIIFLVILIIATVIITILPYFNANSKNTYYILILILLIILTILFYNNFSHINLYEKFAIISNYTIFNVDCTKSVRYTPNSRDATRNNAHRTNNYDVFNSITDRMRDYNKEYSDVNGQMSSGIYTTDNQSFEVDADNYLSSMYIDKKRKIDLYRIKRTGLVNLIEAIKQQIIYLFNVIFIICLLTIVLLIALLLYVNMPQSMTLIIIFVSIAIFLIVIYYIYAVVQPTRLIANKNYWANKNPSQDTYNKL